MHFRNIRRWGVAIGVLLAPTVHGLGLGELTVSSGLGQPFRASIALLGEEINLAPDCFRLRATDGNLPLPADIRFSLESSSGGQTLLKLKTRQAVNDPVGGFVLVAECSGSLERGYVFLLDPLPEPLAQQVATPELSAAGSPPSAMAESRRHAESRKNVQASRGKPEHPSVSKPHHRTKKTTSLPMLVLSGGTRRLAEAERPFSLKFDRSLTYPARTGEAPLSSTDLSDENAALNHKLDHLELQLVALQKRNAELVHQLQAAKAPAPASDKSPSFSMPWLYFLLGLFLLGGAGALILYRRPAAKSTRPSGKASLSPSAPASGFRTLFKRDKTAREEPKASLSPSPSSHDDDLLSYPAKEAHIYDSASDEVEVFLAHVRQNPTASYVPWLLLLDLLQRENRAAEYEEIQQEYRKYFNIEVPAWKSAPSGPDNAGLETYPHVLKELTRLWTKSRILGYLDELLHDTRMGSRAGFSVPAYEEILLLHSICEQKILQDLERTSLLGEVRIVK